MGEGVIGGTKEILEKRLKITKFSDMMVLYKLHGVTEAKIIIVLEELFMSMTVEGFMKMIEDHHIQMIDFKIVDINGQYRHVTIPVQQFSEDTLKNGIGFDASNYGYAVVEKSDMVFIPDLDTAIVDPFCEPPTLSVTGNAMIIDHPENRPLDQYPRNIVQAANRYMKESGIADTMIILPEFEFYLFDSVGWEVQPTPSA